MTRAALKISPGRWDKTTPKPKDRFFGQDILGTHQGPRLWASLTPNLGMSRTETLCTVPLPGKSQRAKTQRAKTLENFSEEKCSQKIFQKISQKIEDITFAGL